VFDSASKRNEYQVYFLGVKAAGWIFRKWEGVVGTGWSGLRIGKGGGHLWIR
jgi:hypothetical protein